MAGKNINVEAWREAVAAGKDCLTLDALQMLAENPSEGSAAQHLSGCPHCQTELAMLKAFESSVPSENEGAAVAWITAHLERQQSSAVAPVAPRVSLWRNFFRAPYLAGALAAVLVVGLGVSLYLSNREPHSLPVNVGTGTMRTGSLRLVSPSGNLDQPPVAFRWEAYPGAKSYSVEVMEVDGTVLWSQQTVENFATPPAELKSKMHPGKMLQWQVTARDGSGKAIATSSHEKFQVKSQHTG